MKNLSTPSVLFVAIVITIFTFSSCAKTDTSMDKPKEELVLGYWQINRVQLRIYYNNVFSKDTILPMKSLPKNFTQFDAPSNFQYCLSSPTIDNGTYQWQGDSIIATTPSKIYRWKKLTLTDVLFTVMSTSTNDPAFPGAKVETYQTFVR